MDRPALELQILEELAALRRTAEALRRTAEALRRTAEANSAELRELRADLAVRSGQDIRCEALLAAASGEFGDDPWSVAGLFDAATDPDAAGLHSAIVAILGKGQSGGAHKRLGIFLSRHLGTTGNWRLELVLGRTREGNKYRVTLLSPTVTGRAGECAEMMLPDS